MNLFLDNSYFKIGDIMKENFIGVIVDAGHVDKYCAKTSASYGIDSLFLAKTAQFFAVIHKHDIRGLLRLIHIFVNGHIDVLLTCEYHHSRSFPCGKKKERFRSSIVFV